jgi:hypothetical protein
MTWWETALVITVGILLATSIALMVLIATGVITDDTAPADDQHGVIWVPGPNGSMSPIFY